MPERRDRMRISINRRTSTKIVDGQTRRKNRSVPTTHRGYVIDRESPGRGYRHVLTKRELQDFLNLIPEWAALSVRIRRIVLAGHRPGVDGCHEFYFRDETGTIYLYAWDEDLWVDFPLPYFHAHRTLLEQLGVSFDVQTEEVFCRFTEAQARAFVLLHIFMHELGHNWDRTHQKHRKTSRGEDYAEKFASRYFDQLFPAYVSAFGHPASSPG